MLKRLRQTELKFCAALDIRPAKILANCQKVNWPFDNNCEKANHEINADLDTNRDLEFYAELEKSPEDEPNPRPRGNYDSETKGHREHNCIHETNEDMQ